jgi:hypothetical protein
LPKDLVGITVVSGRRGPPSPLVSYWQSRPFLEAHLLERLAANTQVRVLDRHKVLRLTAD